MNLAKKYSGVIVPMITPLNEKGAIDKEGVANIMAAFAQHGLSPLVMGTTGESPSFSSEDGVEMVRTVVAHKRNNQQVYAGVVQNCVEEQVNQGKKYLELGADVIVATLPGYYKLTPDQMEQHFIMLAYALGGPLMIYNITATTQMSIPLETINRLSHHPSIWGLKDSERDENRLRESIQSFKQRTDFSFFCGWGAQTVSSLRLGADGVVPSTGNLVPEMYGELWKAAKDHNWQKAEELQILTDQVTRVYQSGKTLGQSLAALKLLMRERKYCHPFMKAPLSRLAVEEESEVVSDWRKVMEEK